MFLPETKGNVPPIVNGVAQSLNADLVSVIRILEPFAGLSDVLDISNIELQDERPARLHELYGSVIYKVSDSAFGSDGKLDITDAIEPVALEI